MDKACASQGPIEVALLGDSITQGLGSKMVNFTDDLQKSLGAGFKVVNLAMTGTTVHYGVNLLESGALDRGGVAVVLYGNVDAQIRPSTKGRVFPRIPARFRGSGMLMPRPFYSKKHLKRMGQRLDNACRRLLSELIRFVDGTEQWVSPDEFRRSYERLVKGLLLRGYRVVCCSCVFIDGRLFPETPEQYLIFNNIIRATAGMPEAVYLDLDTPLKEGVEEHGWAWCYNHDHFHPNGLGYKIMANRIATTVQEVASSQGTNLV